VLNLLLQFSYLQVLDILTTLAFLANGVKEANPLVRVLFSTTLSPLGALVIVKGIALGLACYCWRKHRERLLVRVNFFYAGVVAWNLVAFLLGNGSMSQ